MSEKSLSLKEIAEELKGAGKIILTGHENPDGDAVGSTLGLMHLLCAMGKDASVVFDDTLPFFLSYLPGFDEITRPAETEADILLVLDTQTDRIGKTLEKVHAKHLINIDHHKTRSESVV